MSLSEKFLKWLLESTFLDDLGENIIDIITGTGLETTNFVEIISDVLVPVAISIVGIIWFMEMIERFTQMNYGREHNMWQDFIMMGVQLVFAKAIIQHSPQIINALIEFGKDRKSTLLNSSHVAISYAVFCLTKKIHAIVV